MDITTKAVSAKEHVAIASVEALKGVAISAVQHQLGIDDAAVLSSDATVGQDGSITVTLVELVTDAPIPAEAPAVETPVVPPAAPVVVAVPVL